MNKATYGVVAAIFGLIGGFAGSVLVAEAGRNGSGTYSLPSGNPVVSGTQISSTWANNTLTDIASAITASIAKDGQTTPTANLPMGGYRHTGVGTASARNHYGVVSQIQDGAYTIAGSVSGTNTITASLSPAISAYADGMPVMLVPAGANTGAATLSLNGVTARSIVKGSGSALVANDLLSGVPALLVYDLANTRWSLVNPQTAADSELAAIAALAVTDSNVIVGNGATWVAESGATARTSLGLAIGTDVQAYDAELGEIAALSDADSNFIVGNGTAWIAESGATARTSLGVTATGSDTTYAYRANNLSDLASAATARTNLGLGTMATQAASSVSISGGSVSGITDLAVADGGTGASDAATARSNLGAAASSHAHATSDVTSGTFADARVAATNVTQHIASILSSLLGVDGSGSGIDADLLDGNSSAAFATASHAHAASDVTSGTLVVGRGGTGQTSELGYTRRVTLNWTIQSDPGGTPSGSPGDVFAYY